MKTPMDAPDLKKRLAKGPCYGGWVTLGHPAVAEIMARAGFEWLAVDMEHSAITLAEAQDLIRVIGFCGVSPLVRVTNNDPNLIKRVMDAGAHGVIVPMVNSAEEARDAVAAAYYPPRGRRGVGLARAQGYGFDFPGYSARLAKGAFVAVQIEHIDAVDALEDILAVPGVDAFIIGPYDLSASLGLPGQFEHPRVKAALARVRAVAKRSKVPSGFHVIPSDAREVQRRVREGYRFVAASLDTLYLGNGCRNVMKALGRSAG